MTIEPRKFRLGLYVAINVLFIGAVAIASAIDGAQNPRLLYLVSLFALCSSSIIDLDGWNGRYALLGIFLCVYFIYFGVGDVSALFSGNVTEISSSAVTPSEAVMLAGCLLLIVGYRAAVSIGRAARSRAAPRDWSIAAITLVGLAIWAIGTYATFDWYVHVVTDTTIEATRVGLAGESQLAISLYVLFQMVQPVGILLLAYAWRRRRGAFLLGTIAAVVAVQIVLGFVADIKGLALLAGILVIVTMTLIDGRIPKLWLVGAVIFIQLAFPIFQAYREVVHGGLELSRATVVEHLGHALEIAMSAEKRVMHGPDRAQTFLERLSLRGSVEMIVNRTGVDVDFEHGFTLIPLISTFVPRMVWADKPDIPAGQLVNKAFHVSEDPSTYISPSHLGELYWNFGWLGVIVGMPMIGFLCGIVGSRFNLREATTVTRLLVTVITIQQVIHGFEGTIAVSYVVWLRSLAAIGILHVLFARNPIAAIRFDGGRTQAPPRAAPVAARFPNLMS